MSKISEKTIKKRAYWIEKIGKLNGKFSNDFDHIEKELTTEIDKNGISALIDHLRLCGNLPESYGHDSNAEKLYSKYTVALVSFAFNAVGFQSLVLQETADAEDIEVSTQNYSFVAHAKAFRLSRTAKNPKDFKIEAMHRLKRGKPYAMLVCPIHQLPNTSSQIYQQATTQNVCILTYSHLALLLALSEREGRMQAQALLQRIFKSVPVLNPSKSARNYWFALNNTILSFSATIESLWNTEKEVATESIQVAKEEALTALATEREKIRSMNHQEALNELLKVHKIENRLNTIQAVPDNHLFNLKQG